MMIDLCSGEVARRISCSIWTWPDSLAKEEGLGTGSEDDSSNDLNSTPNPAQHNLSVLLNNPDNPISLCIPPITVYTLLLHVPPLTQFWRVFLGSNSHPIYSSFKP